MRPGGSEIYFLDFKQKRFCPEVITFVQSRTTKAAGGSQVCFEEQVQLPLQAASVQVQDGRIFVVGGFQKTKEEPVALRDCLRIN